jgi:serine/threonine-protein kinase
MDQPDPNKQEWSRLEALFDQAIAATAPERSALLARLRADEPALCTRLEQLLNADAAAGALDVPLETAMGDILQSASFSPGTRVGQYRIVREVGRGGMGAVYLAERADGAYEQQIALKVVRASAVAGLLERRFLRERRILARLDHPHIARMLDAGVTEAGIPWLAMEFVKGEPITAWIASHNVPLADRLRLFLEVCAAVQFAHRNLVVHRDLKPGNILVDAEGRARLLDFGIARLLDDAAAEGVTRTEHLLLTPEYAAPEQIRGEPASTASDVFALGAVLYELLTGQKAVRLASNDIAEILRASEAEPIPPSRVADLPPARRAELRGDLDAIVMKALSRDADRRYGSVETFATDLRRHLANQPIEAQADSWWYSTTKFVRRHRVGVAASVAVVLAVTAGLVGTVWQSYRRGLEARKAEEVKTFALSLFSGADPARARGSELTARELVAEGSTRIEREFAHEPAVKAEVLTFLADIHEKLGEADKALPLTGEALTLLNVAGSTDATLTGNALQVQGRALVSSGKAEDGVARLKEALALHRSDDAQAAVAEDLDQLAIAMRQGGKLDDSRRFTQQAFEIRERLLGPEHPEVATSLNNLGVLAREAGDYPAALKYYERARAIREKELPPDHPDLVVSLNNLGALRFAQGDYAEAEKDFARVLELDRRIYGEKHQMTIGAANNYASSLLLQAKYAEAEPILLNVLDYWRSTAGADHPNALATLSNLASTYRGMGNSAKASPLYLQLIDGWTRVAGPKHPNLAVAHFHLGTILLERGEVDAAEEHLRTSLAIRLEARGDKHPEVADSLRELANLALYRGKIDEAAELSERALAIQKAALDANHPLYAATLIVRGRVLRVKGDYPAALEVERQGLSILRAKFAADHPDVARAMLELGRTQFLASQWDEAQQDLTEARRVLALRFGEGSWRVADADSWLAANMSALKQPGARARLTAARRVLERQLPASHPARVDNTRLAAGIGNT